MNYILILFTLASLMYVDVASAKDRYAVVIGNGKYQSINQLTNASKDARLFSRKLREIGYKVDEFIDLPFSILEQKLMESVDKYSSLPAGSSVVFFYAGHGVQNNLGNLLLPVDYHPSRGDKYLLLQEVLHDFSSGPYVQKVFIIDACREIDDVAGSPLVHSDSYVMPDNSYLAFSTNSKGLAQDGLGDHSPYMESLSVEIGRKGNEINTVFQNVRNSVLQATNNGQSPTQTSSLNTPFFFVEGKEVHSKINIKQYDRDDWFRIKSSQIASDFIGYMDRYPNGKYYLRAEEKLLALRKQDRPTTIKKRLLAVDLVLQKSSTSGKEEIKISNVGDNSVLKDQLMEGDVILEINGSGFDLIKARPVEFLEGAFEKDGRLDIWIKRDQIVTTVSYY